MSDGVSLWRQLSAAVRSDPLKPLPRKLALSAQGWLQKRTSGEGWSHPGTPLWRNAGLKRPEESRVLALRAGMAILPQQRTTPFSEWGMPGLQLQVGIGPKSWEVAREEADAWKVQGGSRALNEGMLALVSQRDSIVDPPAPNADSRVLVSIVLLLPPPALSVGGKRLPSTERVKAMLRLAQTASGHQVIRANGVLGHGMTSYLLIDPVWMELPGEGQTSAFVGQLETLISERVSWIAGELLQESRRALWEELETALGWDLALVRKRHNQPTIPQKNDPDLWLVGAYWETDQSRRFIDEGRWENGYQDKYLDQVREMKVGDAIAIKSTSTQKLAEAGGKTVGKHTIKAVGRIVSNPGDGRNIQVDWQDQEERDWFFYTYRPTVWKIRRDDELALRLRRFVLEGSAQDLSWFADYWKKKIQKPNSVGADDTPSTTGPEPYGVESMVDDGVFVPAVKLERMLRRLRARKNLILQGAPGTGKTFLASRLAYALMEEKAPERVVKVQFHPSTSYEDLVRGYRPDNGQFTLRDGPILQLIQRAIDDPEPENCYVLLIDEINRANLSQALGELFLLLDVEQRGPEHGITPLYRKTDAPDERLWLPKNFYVIGTMNIADRSLALVDFALRRRFAFFRLPPCFGQPFASWLEAAHAPPELISTIQTRMEKLNTLIREDR
ncbi:MAG: 5-methylcytosine-specific restriction protein B, partial [Myxococcota bacterium]